MKYDELLNFILTKILKMMASFFRIFIPKFLNFLKISNSTGRFSVNRSVLSVFVKTNQFSSVNESMLIGLQKGFSGSLPPMVVSYPDSVNQNSVYKKLVKSIIINLNSSCNHVTQVRPVVVHSCLLSDCGQTVAQPI
jgi:hypothetical protein